MREDGTNKNNGEIAMIEPQPPKLLQNFDLFDAGTYFK